MVIFFCSAVSVLRRRYLGFSIGPWGVVYQVRGVVYYVIHGREVKKKICDWPDGFYELAPEILTCDLYLHSECKMDWTFFLFPFASFRRKTNILIYTNIGLTHENNTKKMVQSNLHLECKYKSHVKISDANS